MARAHSVLDRPSQPAKILLFFGAASAFAFCSLAYELILAKLIAELTGNPLVWESISMGSFLLGLGWRSLVIKPIHDKEAVRQLINTEIAIIIAVVLAAFGSIGAEILYRIYLYSEGATRSFWAFPSVWILGGLTQIGPFVVGWFSGYELQFFIHLKEGTLIKRQTPKVLAVYHFGALVATVSFPWFLAHAWSPLEMIAAVAAFNTICLVVLWCFFGKNVLKTNMPSIFGLRTPMWALPTLAVLLLIGSTPSLEHMSRKNFYHNRLSWRADARGIFDYQEPVGLLDLPEALQTKPDVERIRTPYQVIDLIRHTETAPDDEGRPAGVLHINGRFQLQSQTSAAYHEPMVHLPLALATKPVRHVLVLGGGDGALVRELRRHEATIESAVLVDIDAEIVRLARTEPFLKELNDDAFTWPKLRIEIGDAMAYLRGHKEQFDAVFIDLTYPYEFDSARFYSVEFFRLIRRRLNQDGFFVIGSPTDLLAARHTPWQDILYATVHTASYPTQIAINGPRDHFLVAGLGTLHTSPTLDPSLGLKALNPTSLGSWRVEKMTGEPRLQMINSVMQPRSLGIEDGFF